MLEGKSALHEACREQGTWFAFLVGPRRLQLILFIENFNMEAMLSHQPGCGPLHLFLGQIEMNEMHNNLRDNHAPTTQRHMQGKENGFVCL